MGKTIIYIHGSGPKPDAQSLSRYWNKAMAHGLERHHRDKLEAFNEAQYEFVYYGDLNNENSARLQKEYDPELDMADRNNVLDALMAMKPKSFASRRQYEHLPGRSLIGELIADVGLPVARTLGFSERVIVRMMPDLARYWQDGSTIRQRIREAIQAAALRRDEVALIAHCIGSVAAYDTLWELSHGSSDGADQEWYHGEKVKLWVTLGSPLGDETVKAHLLGAKDSGRRYPGNIVKWVNFSAEDDYVSHDNTVRNDFQGMLDQHRLSHVEDHRIFNFAVRYGKSNPHSVAGYLVHPRVARTISEWL